MLRFIYLALAVTGLLIVSGSVNGHVSTAPVWTVLQVADDTGPTTPPFPLGPKVADDTGPTAPPFPLAA
jgi:hypothetical protein